MKVIGIAEMSELAVIAEMATATLSESRDTLCHQAGQWLKRALTVSAIRVQRHFRKNTAQDIGQS